MTKIVYAHVFQPRIAAYRCPWIFDVHQVRVGFGTNNDVRVVNLAWKTGENCARRRLKINFFAPSLAIFQLQAASC